jgi:membrane protease YdiL (CAAX protease family)
VVRELRPPGPPNRLHELIRRLQPGMEFVVVVSWAFGLAIFSSVLSIGATSTLPTFTNQALTATIVIEILQFAFLAWFLKVRGWTLEKFGLAVTARGTLWGLGLLAGVWAITIVVQVIATTVFDFDMPAAMGRYPKAVGLSMEVVFIASTVNGVFEELFVAGYVISVLKPVRGLWAAVNVSTALRMLYHLYQGPLGLLTIVPMGLLLGHVYARTGQLWPLMVAHVLLDIVGLALATN